MTFLANVLPHRLVGGPLPALATLLTLAGCGQGHDLDCLKSNGSPVVQRRAINRQLKQLLVYDNVDVVIVPDTARYAEVRAGENVIGDIEFSTPAGPSQLVIRNTSRCNWVRSYDTPREVRLHLPYLKQIEQHGYGLISTEGQWAQDTLYARIQSTGDVNLNVRSTYLFVDSFDAGDLTLSGYAHDFHPNLGSNGFLFASALRADDCFFHTYPTWVGDAHVRVSGTLGGLINGTGTFYYTGSPTFIDAKGTNTAGLVAE